VIVHGALSRRFGFGSDACRSCYRVSWLQISGIDRYGSVQYVADCLLCRHIRLRSTTSFVEHVRDMGLKFVEDFQSVSSTIRSENAGARASKREVHVARATPPTSISGKT
jgi:hypothetical protein